MNAVDETAALKARVFRLHLFHDLLAKRTDFRTARYRHVFVAFVSEKTENKKLFIKTSGYLVKIVPGVYLEPYF